MAATITISFEKSTSGIDGTHLPGGIGASNRFQSSLNSSRFLITKRNGFSDGKLLIHGSGGGLVPPKRSGRETAVIVGPGNIEIGSGLPRHTIGGVSCAANHIERLVRTEKTIKASFIIATSDKMSAAWRVIIPATPPQNTGNRIHCRIALHKSRIRAPTARNSERQRGGIRAPTTRQY